jgi:hypothetical protein
MRSSPCRDGRILPVAGSPRGPLACGAGYAAAVRPMNRLIISLAVAGVVGLSGCGSSAKPGASKTTTPASVTPSTGHVAIPVSANPSKSAQMICGPEVKSEVAQLLGVQITQPLDPKWVDHVYSCHYTYGTAVLTLAVKELANRAQTDQYFASMATKLGKTENISGLGQGAFTTKNLSAVVRKDYKVLLVDISKLPAQFGRPPDTRANIALNVAATIMGCWTGA